MKRRGQMLCTGLAAGLLIAGWALRFSDEVPQSQPAISTKSVTAKASGQLPSQPSEHSSDDNSDERSGDVVTGTHFILDDNTINAFDRFIFNHEGLSAQALKTRYAHDVAASQFEPVSAEYAVDLFTRYVDYKVRLKTLDKPVDVTDMSAMAHRLQVKQDLQRMLFTEKEYDYFFAQDAAYDNAALERLQIAADDGLSPQQKSEFIERQLDRLPEAQKRSFQPSMTVNRLDLLQRTFDNPETRYQAVSAEFGHDVALRLNKVAETQSRWQEKVRSFKHWRENLMNSGELSDEQISARVTQKTEAMFSATEQRRLQVFLENPALLEEGE